MMTRIPVSILTLSSLIFSIVLPPNAAADIKTWKKARGQLEIKNKEIENLKSDRDAYKSQIKKLQAIKKPKGDYQESCSHCASIAKNFCNKAKDEVALNKRDEGNPCEDGQCEIDPIDFENVCYQIYTSPCYKRHGVLKEGQRGKVRQCWAAKRDEDIEGLKAKIEEQDGLIETAEEEGRTLETAFNKEEEDCPNCSALEKQEKMLKAMGYQMNAYGGVTIQQREPSTFEKVLAGISVGGSLLLGGVNSYFGYKSSQAYANAYQTSYSDYAAKAAEMGVPFYPPNPYGGQFGGQMGSMGVNPWMYGLAGGLSALTGLAGGGGGIYVGAGINGMPGMGGWPYGGGYGSTYPFGGYPMGAGPYMGMYPSGMYPAGYPVNPYGMGQLGVTGGFGVGMPGMFPNGGIFPNPNGGIMVGPWNAMPYYVQPSYPSGGFAVAMAVGGMPMGGMPMGGMAMGMGVGGMPMGMGVGGMPPYMMGGMPMGGMAMGMGVGGMPMGGMPPYMMGGPMAVGVAVGGMPMGGMAMGMGGMPPYMAGGPMGFGMAVGGPVGFGPAVGGIPPYMVGGPMAVGMGMGIGGMPMGGMAMGMGVGGMPMGGMAMGMGVGGMPMGGMPPYAMGGPFGVGGPMAMGGPFGVAMAVGGIYPGGGGSTFPGGGGVMYPPFPGSQFPGMVNGFPGAMGCMAPTMGNGSIFGSQFPGGPYMSGYPYQNGMMSPNIYGSWGQSQQYYAQLMAQYQQQMQSQGYYSQQYATLQQQMNDVYFRYQQLMVSMNSGGYYGGGYGGGGYGGAGMGGGPGAPTPANGGSCPPGTVPAPNASNGPLVCVPSTGAGSTTTPTGGVPGSGSGF